MNNSDRNSNRHYEIRFENGETRIETCRNSFGSFVKMMRRLEATGIAFEVTDELAKG